jgi:hypothetical protein
MMTRMMKGKGFLAAAAGVLLSTSAAMAWPPLWLTPGSWGWLSGTTSAQLPELAGVVLHDRLTSFEIRNAAGNLLYEGRLQDRVVRSNATGDAIFSYRIRDTNPALIGDLVAMDVTDFSDFFGAHVDFRPDGLGSTAPSRGIRNADGSMITFAFWPDVIDGGESSRFCFIKPPGVKDYADGGMVTLHLITGESVSIAVKTPVAP